MNKGLDVSKFDFHLEQLVLALAEWNKKNSANVFVNKQDKPKKVIKKLNVELIRQVLKETEELQNKRNSKV